METIVTGTNRNEQEIKLKQNVFGLNYTEPESNETKDDDMLLKSGKNPKKPTKELPAT